MKDWWLGDTHITRLFSAKNEDMESSCVCLLPRRRVKCRWNGRRLIDRLRRPWTDPSVTKPLDLSPTATRPSSEFLSLRNENSDLFVLPQHKTVWSYYPSLRKWGSCSRGYSLLTPWCSWGPSVLMVGLTEIPGRLRLGGTANWMEEDSTRDGFYPPPVRTKWWRGYWTDRALVLNHRHSCKKLWHNQGFVVVRCIRWHREIWCSALGLVDWDGEAYF